MRILILDDDAFALRLVRVQLEQLGFTDVTAHELPREALAVLEADVSAADVILLDLQMPEIDGIEFLRHLARLRFAGGVILISGEDERVLHTAMTLGKAHKLDLRGALHKPITPQQLWTLLGTPAARTDGGKRAIKTYPADRLRQAIHGGELVNFYQPKIEFATGRVTGVEALVRWQHPEDGLVFPDAFIGVAEEHDLIDEYWVWLHPVILGRGKRLFDGKAMPAGFGLVSSSVNGKGVVIAHYERTGEVRQGSFSLPE